MAARLWYLGLLVLLRAVVSYLGRNKTRMWGHLTAEQQEHVDTLLTVAEWLLLALTPEQDT